MIDLNKLSNDVLGRMDPSGMGKIISDFPQQCREAIKIARKADIKLPKTSPRNVIVCGMGGSAIAGDILASYLSDKFPSAIIVQRNYGLPAWVKEEDLVIISSYSGETEETLSNFGEAIARKAMVAAITSGGTLKKRCDEARIPYITIPGGLPPRGALGYSFFSLLGLFISSGIIPGQDESLDETFKMLDRMSAEYSPENAKESNRAKLLASAINDKLPVIYASSDLLAPVARRWANQLNENAKVLSYWAVMPELCHNEIVGWEKLPDIRKRAAIVMLRDQEDHPRNTLRFDTLQDIIKEDSAGITAVPSEGSSKLSRMFSLIYLADFISFYLAMLNEVDPMPVKRIDKLKSVLKERK